MKLSPTMSWLLLIAAILVSLHFISGWNTSHEIAKRESFVDQLRSGRATPAAFEATCGKAKREGAAAESTVLDYGDVRVTFPARNGAASFERIVWTQNGPHPMPADEDWALSMIRCAP